MSKMVQIRNMPEDLHRKVKVRAAEEGLSLSDYLLRVIQRQAEVPTRAEVRARVERLPPLESPLTSAEIIRQERDSR